MESVFFKTRFNHRLGQDNEQLKLGLLFIVRLHLLPTNWISCTSLLSIALLYFAKHFPADSLITAYYSKVHKSGFRFWCTASSHLKSFLCTCKFSPPSQFHTHTQSLHLLPWTFAIMFFVFYPLRWHLISSPHMMSNVLLETELLFL